MQRLFAFAILISSCLVTAQVAHLEGSQTQPSQIRNAKLETVSASGHLQQQISTYAAAQNGIVSMTPPASGNDRPYSLYCLRNVV